MSDRVHPFSEKIRAYLDRHAKPSLEEQALRAVLDHADSLLTDFQGRPSRVGAIVADAIVYPIATIYGFVE